MALRIETYPDLPLDHWANQRRVRAAIADRAEHGDQRVHDEQEAER